MREIGRSLVGENWDWGVRGREEGSSIKLMRERTLSISLPVETAASPSLSYAKMTLKYSYW